MRMRCETSRLLGVMGLFVLASATLSMVCPEGRAQTAFTDYSLQYGAPAFNTAEPAYFGFVNAANGNLHVEFPLTSAPQRGTLPFWAKLAYDSRIWKVVNNGTSKSWQPANVLDGNGNVSNGGWRMVTPAQGTAGADLVPIYCAQNVDYYRFSNYRYIDASGTQRTFPLYYETSASCHTPSGLTTQGWAVDGSGYQMTAQTSGAAAGNVNIAYAPNGNQVCILPNSATVNTPLRPCMTYGRTVLMEDSNGNYISYVSHDGNPSDAKLYDTLDRTPITWTSSGNTTTTYTIYNSNGSTSSIVVTYGTFYVHTAFGQSGVTEYQGHFTAISSIQFPDTVGTYSFSYDTGTSDTDPTIHYGNLTSISLPQGGTVSYGWANNTDVNGAVNRWATAFNAAGLGWSSTFSSCSTCSPRTQTVTVSDQEATPNRTVFTFNMDLTKDGAWKSSVSYYTGSSTLLMTVTNTYQNQRGNADFGCSGTTPCLFAQLTNSQVSMPSSQGTLVKQTTYSYDTYTYTYRLINYTGSLGQLREKDEYVYGVGGAGGLKRKTLFSYKADGNSSSSPYTQANLVNLVTNIQVLDSGGTQVAQRLLLYDTNTLASVTGMTHHDDTNYGTGNNTRGNLWQIQDWDAPLPTLGTVFYRDTTGQIPQIQDRANNYTNLSYSSTFQNAYVTQVTNPLGQNVTSNYDFNTGLPTSTTDANGKSTTFSYDNFNRPTNTAFPDGGCKQNAYPGGEEFDFYTCRTSTTKVQTQVLTDGVGRPYYRQLVSDPVGHDIVWTSFDSHGRVSGVTNPYRSTSDPTYGSENYSRDGLGRITQVARADGSAANTYYGAAVGTSGGISNQLCSTATYGVGYPTLAVDEAGKKRQSWTDAFGRSIEVDEPDSSGSLTLNTCYGYDLLDDLTSVVQGSQTRSYTYDPMSRVTSATTPESGTTSFYYTTSGGSVCAGSPSAVCRRTDARNITTTYSYDALSRLTSKTYSDTTPAAYYSYDEGSVTLNGTTYTLGNTKGRMSHTSAANGTAMTIYSYDVMGRVVDHWQCAPFNCSSPTIWHMNYTYDLAGDLLTWLHPWGFLATYTVNDAQQVTSVVDNMGGSHASNLAPSITYNAAGQITSLTNGCAGTGCVQVQETRDYNKRLQPVRIQLGTASNPNANYCWVYNYYGVANPTSCAVPTGGTSGNNGNVTGYYYLDHTNPYTHTDALTYDTLNRLTSSVATGSIAHNLTFTYDRYGNMACQTNGQTNGPCPNWTFSASTNRITTSGFSYDAAGNMTSDGIYTWSWDAEGRWSGGNTYDALGQLVQNGATAFPYDAFGNQAAWYTVSSGVWFVMYVPFQGQILADAANDVFFHRNALGSVGYTTQANGSYYEEYVYYPWGQIWANPVGRQYEQRFASMPFLDTVDPIFGTPFRTQEPRLGRWLSPDPLGGGVFNPQSFSRGTYSTPFRGYQPNKGHWLSPGALRGDVFNPQPLNTVLGAAGAVKAFSAGNVFNPQSLNRYAYVLNNPATNIDPLGLSCIKADDGTTVDDNDGKGCADAGVSPSPSGAGGDTTGTSSPDTITVSSSNDNSGNAFPGEEIATLSNGLEALTTPLENIAVSGGLFLTGAGVVAIGAGSTAYVCGQTALLGCGAFAAFGGAPMIAGGVSIIKTGYDYTINVTIPSIVGLF